MDPVTIAVGAFTAIKAGVSAGRSIADLGKDIGSLFDAIDDCRNAHTKKKSNIFKMSANEEALDTFVAQQKAKDLEEELREIIIATRGYSAWGELIALRSEIRRTRKEEEAAARRASAEFWEKILVYGGVSVCLLLGVGLATVVLMAMTGKFE